MNIMEFSRCLYSLSSLCYVKLKFNIVMTLNFGHLMSQPAGKRNSDFRWFHLPYVLFAALVCCSEFTDPELSTKHTIYDYALIQADGLTLILIRTDFTNQTKTDLSRGMARSCATRSCEIKMEWHVLSSVKWVLWDLCTGNQNKCLLNFCCKPQHWSAWVSRCEHAHTCPHTHTHTHLPLCTCWLYHVVC